MPETGEEQVVPVVDDDPNALDLLAHTLQKAGMRVRITSLGPARFSATLCSDIGVQILRCTLFLASLGKIPLGLEHQYLLCQCTSHQQINRNSIFISQFLGSLM